MSTKKSNTTKLAGAGIFTAAAASLCCITPVLVLISGAAGAASAFSWMEPFRPWLIGITVLVLGFAWYQKLKPRTAEEIACACEEDKKTSFWQSKIFLGIVTVFAVLMMAFPYYGSVFSPDHKKEVAIAHQNNIQTLYLNIQGLTCPTCDNNVENAMYQSGGVINAKADYRTGKAVVKFDKSKTSADKIIKSINATSYKVIGDSLEHNKKEVATIHQNDIQTLYLNIQGLTCPTCDNNVENAMYQSGGVINAKADYRTGKAVVKFDKSKTSADKIIKSINATSYKVVGDSLEH
ncbi:MAG: hypothetical protein IEMM0006_1927 [bacterium]|nr:MAG: hypothetical protein IEMM0006_1927 [bacterium]